MPVVQTGYEHISLDERKTPFIAGTTLKVIELIQEKLAYGWGAEEIQLQHPSLTLGQIYSALAYYADHCDELNSEIEQRMERADATRHTVRSSSLLKKLHAKGLL